MADMNGIGQRIRENHESQFYGGFTLGTERAMRMADIEREIVTKEVNIFRSRILHSP